MMIYSVVQDIGLSREIKTVSFNENITQIIRKLKVLAATDASVKDGKMGEAQIISNYNGNLLSRNKLYHKIWNENSNISVEALILLELIQVIERKSWHINKGKIIIAVDYREVYQTLQSLADRVESVNKTHIKLKVCIMNVERLAVQDHE